VHPSVRFAATPAVALLSMLVGCAGSARSGLHFSARPDASWSETGPGRYSTAMLGAAVVVDLHADDPGIEIAVENPTQRAVEVRLGPEATRTPDAAIGEYQPRRLDRSRVEGASDFAPYLTMQPVQVEPGIRTLFALDNPLGRDPSIGQYLVLVVEIRAQGRFERRLLPLQATNTSR
jgi:hypothetical protein